jgi:16S rRNA (uracil1498-N3)-methyltransferase
VTRLLLDRPAELGERIEIRDRELHYLTRVRRHRKGEPLEVRDGEGRAFRAEILSWDRHSALVLLADELDPSLDDRPIHPVELLVAVPKRNLFDLIVRQASETGVAALHPLLTRRGVGQPGAGKLDRWRRIAEESMRQCGRPRPVQVHEALGFEEALGHADLGTKLILHTTELGAGLDPWSSRAPADPPITVAVGPEGGFAPEEITAARRCGFAPVHLEMPVLRVETAAVAAGVLAIGLLQARRGAQRPLTS